jgi:Bacterial membrane protein YfhO
VATSGQFNDPAYRLASQWEDYRYYDFQPTHPRAYFVQHVLSADDDQAAASLVAAPNFDQWNTAVVLGQVAVDDSQPVAPEETATIVARSANSVQIEAVAEAPRLLVIADADYPGWRAWLDGRRVPILKTNLALQGVLVPPGQHSLRLDFLPNSFILGLSLSAVTWLGVLAWLVLGWRRERRPQAAAMALAA